MWIFCIADIHIKYQALFSMKKKQQKNAVCYNIGALRV